jgi:hypothetical protein
VTLMDRRRARGLPDYDSAARCHWCGEATWQRVEVDDPERGLRLLCGVCALVAGAVAEPLDLGPAPPFEPEPRVLLPTEWAWRGWWWGRG